MKMKSRRILLAASVLLAAASLPAYAADVTVRQAEEAAQKAVPADSRLVSTQDDGNHYEIRFYREADAEWYELDVSKSSGKVVSLDSERAGEEGGSSVTLDAAGAGNVVKGEHPTAVILSAALDQDDGLSVYEVKFRADDCYGEYAVHPATGAVLERDLSMGRVPAAGDTAKLIARDAAAAAALAKYPGGTVADMDLEWEDSSYRYEIEVLQNGARYDVDVDAQTGAVLWTGEHGQKKTVRSEKVTPPAPSGQADAPSGQSDASGAGITREEAESIALGQAPGAAVRKIELDRDDGVLLYEGELYKDGFEYEFEIDAATGAILQWEADLDD